MTLRGLPGSDASAFEAVADQLRIYFAPNVADPADDLGIAWRPQVVVLNEGFCMVIYEPVLPLLVELSLSVVWDAES